MSKEGGQAFRGNSSLTDEQLELRRLREEVKRLTMEKDILKRGNGILRKGNELKYSVRPHINCRSVDEILLRPQRKQLHCLVRP